jgi:hypothetical protein
MRQHLGERLLVVVPAIALGDVGGRELPVVVRQIEAAQQANPLLLLREVEEQLDDPEAVVAEVSLPVVDLAVAPVPDAALRAASGSLWRSRYSGCTRTTSTSS